MVIDLDRIVIAFVRVVMAHRVIRSPASARVLPDGKESIVTCRVHGERSERDASRVTVRMERHAID